MHWHPINVLIYFLSSSYFSNISASQWFLVTTQGPWTISIISNKFRIKRFFSLLFLFLVISYFFNFVKNALPHFALVSFLFSFYVLRLSPQNKFNSHQPFNVRSNRFVKYPICHFVSIFYQLFLLNVKKHNYKTVLKNLLLSATCSAIMKKVVT